MNTKISNRKTKTPTARVATKTIPATKTSSKPASAVPVSGKARKSSTADRVKATPSPSVIPQIQPDSARSSKQARLIEMLQTGAGATIDQMMALTGWQAHTVRGTISGALRKKLGLNVTCAPATNSSASLYRIVEPAVGA